MARRAFQPNVRMFLVWSVIVVFVAVASFLLSSCSHRRELLHRRLAIPWPVIYIDNQTEYDATVVLAYSSNPADRDAQTVPKAEKRLFRRTFGTNERSILDLSKYPDFKVEIEYSNGEITTLTRTEFERQVIRQPQEIHFSETGVRWLVLGTENSTTAIPVLYIDNLSGFDALVTVDYGDLVESEQLQISNEDDARFTWRFSREYPPNDFPLSKYPLSELTIEYSDGHVEKLNRAEFERRLANPSNVGAWWLTLEPRAK